MAHWMFPPWKVEQCMKCWIRFSSPEGEKEQRDTIKLHPGREYLVNTRNNLQVSGFTGSSLLLWRGHLDEFPMMLQVPLPQEQPQRGHHVRADNTIDEQRLRAVVDSASHDRGRFLHFLLNAVQVGKQVAHVRQAKRHVRVRRKMAYYILSRIAGVTGVPP